MSSSTCARRILTICATPTSPISSSLRCHAHTADDGGCAVQRWWVVAQGTWETMGGSRRSPTQGMREAADRAEAVGRRHTPYCCRPPVLSASMRSGLTTLGLAAAADEGRDGLPLLGRGGMGGLLPPLLGRASACVILSDRWKFVCYMWEG